MNKGLINILLFLISFNALGQTLTLTIKTTDEIPPEIKYLNNKGKNFSSKQEAKKYLYQILTSLYSDGFLGASIDSIFQSENSLKALLTIGGKYEWAQLKNGNIDEEWLTRLGYKIKFMDNRKMHYEQVASILKSIVAYAANNGYPFATVYLKNVNIEQSNISAELFIEKGDFFAFDEIVVLGNAVISPGYLQNFLDIKIGDPYNEKLIRKIDNKLNDLGFLDVVKPTKVLFSQGKVKIKLFIDKRPTSRVNGILGLAPNSNGNNKLLITGDLSLNLVNPFGNGMALGLKWQKLQLNSQNLQLQCSYPYLFDLPIGASLDFNLEKVDTLYLNVDFKSSLFYQFSGDDKIAFFYEKSATNIISKTSNSNEGNRGYTSLNIDFYGASLSINSLDYMLNPRKGFFVETEGSAGVKKYKAKKNTSEASDTLKNENLIYKGTINSGIFLPLGQKGTLFTRLMSKKIFDPNIFFNQLYRFGGLNDLRGFDDGSIFADFYSILTVEYRFLTAKNDHLALFFDYAYYERMTTIENTIDRPFGFGLGYDFETKAGIFSINYALGKKFDDPIGFREGKFHFGYKGIF